MSLAPWFLRAVMIATVVIAFIAGARLGLARVRAVRKASAERERFAARAARHKHALADLAEHRVREARRRG